MTKDEMLEAIEKMNVLELAELVKALEDKFGVSAAAPVAMAMPAAAAVEEEKTEFTVVLESFGDQKLKVIKAVRELTTLGLKEAKALVEAVPSNIKEDIGKQEADDIKAKLETLGAKVKLA